MCKRKQTHRVSDTWCHKKKNLFSVIPEQEICAKRVAERRAESHASILVAKEQEGSQGSRS